MKDPYHLQRFVDAQGGVYDQVAAELRAGLKRSHWIWFIFPQVEGLGRSATSMRFAIKSQGEARAYLAHPILGPRLVECVELMLQHAGTSISSIMGYPDDLKFRSSMTLFDEVSDNTDLFSRALAAFFSGRPDEATLKILATMNE